MRRPLPFAIFVAAGIALDLISKELVFQRAGTGPVLLPGVLQITRAKNTGVAFSWLKDSPQAVFAIAAVLIGVMLWIYARSWRTAPGMLIFALGLLLIGALGNLVDRLALGYVRDFIDFIPELPLIGRWAVFNVADICICIGVGMYLLSELFLKTEPPATAANT